MKYEIKLTKIQSSHQKIRSNVIEGFCQELPTVGQPFKMCAEPLDLSMDIRLIETTPVKNINKLSKGMEFKTNNSIYALEVIREEPDN